MSTPGTSLATLQTAGSALVAERRLRNRVAQQIRGATWAREVDRDTQFAIAEYCQARDIDAATEIDILGGRIYKNAHYYERKGAELIAAGIARSVDQAHVEHDPRLDEAHAEAQRFAADAEKAGDAEDAAYWREQAREARREMARRRAGRIEFNAPEKAAAVVVTRIVLVNGVEVAGCNWCGNGVRKGDPVGDADPSKTAETRSARRAWRKLAGMVAQSEALTRHPQLARLAASEITDDNDSVAVHDAIAASHATAAGQRAETFPALTDGRGHDGYRPLAAPDDAYVAPAGELPLTGGREPANTAQRVDVPPPGRAADALAPRDPRDGRALTDDEAWAQEEARLRREDAEQGEGA